MTTTQTIADFILARLAEDEAAAAGGGRHPDPTTFARDNYGYLWIDPARVLADVEAKRRIVEAWRSLGAGDGKALGGDELDHSEATGAYIALQFVAKLLALPFASHPDYRIEWSL